MMLEGDQNGMAGFFQDPAGDAAPDVADLGQEPPADAAAPTLDGLDDETRARVEQYYAQQNEAMRQQMQQYGLDLTADGRPVVVDPSRFGQWSGQAGAQRAQPAQQFREPQEPQTQQPAEDDLDFDPLQMDGRRMAEFVDRRVAKATEALQQQNQRLMQTLQWQSANDALQGVREALRQQPFVTEEALRWVDHPDFAEAYRQHAATMDPAALTNPSLRATVALGIMPHLDRARMPAPQREYQQQQPAPRDQQGRFVSQAQSVAEGMVNRQGVGQVAPARSGMAPPAPADVNADIATRFITGFQGLQSSTKKFPVPTARDIEALSDNDPMTQWKSFQAARAARGQR